MGREGFDDAFDHIAVRPGPASNVDVGLGVEGSALVGEPAKRRGPIRRPEERAGVTAAGAVGQNLDRGIEPDGDRALVEDLAGARVDEGSAAGRDDTDLAFYQPGDQAALAIAEVGLAEPLEYFRGRISGSILNRRIAVDERQAEALRKAAPDGRFTRAHQSDEDDWTIETGGQLFHARGYTAGRKVGQKPIPIPKVESAMPRATLILIVLIVLLIGGAFLLSSRAREVPTQRIEVDVTNNAGTR